MSRAEHVFHLFTFFYVIEVRKPGTDYCSNTVSAFRVKIWSDSSLILLWKECRVFFVPNYRPTFQFLHSILKDKVRNEVRPSVRSHFSCHVTSSPRGFYFCPYCSSSSRFHADYLTLAILHWRAKVWKCLSNKIHFSSEKRQSDKTLFHEILLM